MSSHPGLSYFLDDPPALEGLSGHRSWSGWIFRRGDHSSPAVRLRSQGGTVVAVFGLPRQDVAKAHPTEPGALLSGFQGELTAKLGGWVVLEWLDTDGTWHEFWRDALARRRGFPPKPPRIPANRVPALLDRISRAIHKSSWGAAWRELHRAEADWNSLLSHPAIPPAMSAALDAPASELTEGNFVPLSGWVCDGRAPLRRLFAHADPGGAVHVIFPLPRPDVPCSAQGGQGASGFTGMVKLPAGGPGWFFLRVYAESADGHVHLVLIRRCFRAAASPPSAATRLYLGLLALAGRYRLEGGWRQLASTRSRESADVPRPCLADEPVGPAAILPPNPADPLISLVVPVFNPPANYLRAMIASVQAQQYPRWELCLADDASTDPGTRPLLEQLARSEPRLRVVFRQTNGQIARATQSALGLARGDFVAFVDQDDLLAPGVLAAVAGTIGRQPDAQFLYTDRDKVDDTGRHYDREVRGAWNPAMALTHNYLHQLTVVRRDLVERAGGFRPDYFGSQDLDFYLRCHELLRPHEVVHVPILGYHWRAHAGSTARRGDQKDYMYDSARRGICDALQRRGLRAIPFLPDFTSFYGLNLHQLRWDGGLLRENPVSIVLAVPAAGDAWWPIVAAVSATVPAGAIQIIVVSRHGPSVSGPVDYVGASPDTSLAGLFNLGAARARHPLLLLLDARVKPLAPGWLEDLAGWLSVPGVDAVGPRLVQRDGQLSSAGWTIAADTGLPRPLFAREPAEDPGRQFLARAARDTLLLDPAIVLTRTALFRAGSGYDSARFPAAHFAADYCLRLRAQGSRCVFSPQSELQIATAENNCAAADEDAAFRERHPAVADPWIPPAYFAAAEVPSPRRPWMPHNTVEFRAGWFHLETAGGSPPMRAGRQVLSGWCLPSPGQVILEIRVRHGRAERLVAYGHARPDLAAHTRDHGSFLPVGFDLELDLPAGRTTLEFHALVRGQGWIAIHAVVLIVLPAGQPVVHGVPTAWSVAQWSECLRQLLDTPAWQAAPGALAIAEALVRATPWRDAMRNPSLPFRGFWHEPTGIARQIHGGIEVRGWLFHESLPIRRVVGSFNFSDWLELPHQKESAGIATLFPQYGGTGSCGVAGYLPVPADQLQPLTLRIWAELPDGTWHLVYVRRCRVETPRAGSAPAPLDWRDLARAMGALQNVLHRESIPGPSWRARWRAARRIHAERHGFGLAAEIHRDPAQPAAPASAHVLLVTHNLNREGAPFFLLDIARHLAGHVRTKLTIVTPLDGPLRRDFEALGATVRLVDRTALWTAQSPAAARMALADLAHGLDATGASLVIANTIESFWAVHAAHRAGCPSLFYIHEPGVLGVHYLGDVAVAVRRVAAASLQLATTVSYPAEAARAYYQPWGVAGNQRIQPGWTDVGLLASCLLPSVRRDMRAELGLRTDERLVINVGTLCARKGQLFFLRAVEQLQRTTETGPVRFLVIGDPGCEYGEQVAAWVARSQLGVTFVPATADIGRYFAAADLFVLSSFEEGFPRVLLEAMAFGLPVVATQVHSIPGITRPGREALLVPPGDPPAMAAAMARLLTDRELAAHLGRQAQVRLHACFSAEEVLPRHLATILELAPDLQTIAPRIPARDWPEPVHLVS